MPTDRLLLHGGTATAEVAPDAGGALTGYWTEQAGRRIDWLRPAPPDAARTDVPSRVACFPMVPFFGRIRAGRLALADRLVRLPWNLPGIAHAVHGHGWQRAWQVAERTDSRVALILRHAGDAWPWAYDAVQDIGLDAAGALTVALGVTNRSLSPMPAGLGLHPYFPRGAGATLGLRVAAMWESDAELMPVRRAAVPAALTRAAGALVDELDLDHVFEGWDGRALIAWPGRGTLDVESRGSGGFVVVVARPGKPTFQLEPVTHNNDAFNAAAQGQPGTGAVFLAPGASQSLSLTLRPRPG